MTRKTCKRSVRGAGWVGLLLLVTGTGGWLGHRLEAERCCVHGTSQWEVARADAGAADLAAGGWRPKRPTMCAAAVVATAVAGGLASGVPGGSVVVFVAMVPLLLDACG